MTEFHTEYKKYFYKLCYSYLLTKTFSLKNMHSKDLKNLNVFNMPKVSTASNVAIKHVSGIK